MPDTDRINGITRDTFKTLDTDGKLCTLFDSISSLRYTSDKDHIQCHDQQGACEKRFRKIENRKITSTLASAFGGMIGGALAVWAKIKLLG